MELVINEWFLEFIRFDAELSKKQQFEKFFTVFKRKSDKIYIKRNSQFTRKFYRYMKDCERDEKGKLIFKEVMSIFLDSNKTVIMEEHETPQIPTDIQEKCHRKDLYLIELALFSKDRIIITTDEKLKEKLRDFSVLQIYLFPEFIKTYDS